MGERQPKYHFKPDEKMYELQSPVDGEDPLYLQCVDSHWRYEVVPLEDSEEHRRMADWGFVRVRVTEVSKRGTTVSSMSWINGTCFCVQPEGGVQANFRQLHPDEYQEVE